MVALNPDSPVPAPAAPPEAGVGPLMLNQFLIEERGGPFHPALNYNILDPASGRIIMTCRENAVSLFTRILRYSSLRRATPFDLTVAAASGEPLMHIRRGVPVFVSRVAVLDPSGVPIGEFCQKAFSVGGAFDVLDARERLLCRLRGHAAGREFAFVTPDGVELARISRKWAGIARELITGEDRFLLEIDPAVPEDEGLRQLLLASAICVGTVLKIVLP